MPQQPQDIIAVQALKVPSLFLVFEDGRHFTVNLASLMRGPIFEEIFERGLFDHVRVDADSGTITWPNGAALDPWVLRQLAEAQASQTDL